MEVESMDETRPMEIGNENGDASPPDEGMPPSELVMPRERRRFPWLRWVLLMVAVLIGITALSAYLGYQSGIRERTQFEATQVAQAVSEQYALGLQDLEAERYEVARQRFEYVIELNPNYPGVTEKLAEVLLALNATATPTPKPTPTPVPITPTPDLRGEAELFAQAEEHIADEEWSEAITTLETLRKKNPAYEAIQVDGMFYLALRNRGVQKIGLGNLEEGIYDLTLAEGFGPLDTEANSWRTWARYYITGASFWGVDWEQAVYYFGQVAPLTPNLHDGRGWTAAQRYLEALINYAEWLEDQKEWCSAEQQYQTALELGADPALEEARQFAAEKCRPPQPQRTQPAAPTPTPEGGETPTPQETPIPTEGTPPPETSPTPGEETPPPESSPTPSGESPTQEPSPTPQG
jgi:tetratricopeptide (TPR) repeat protein